MTTTAGNRDARHTFLVLDGMRGVAALIVLLGHAEGLLGFAPRSNYLAVDLFFCLSGFVLAYAYDGKFARGMSTTEFMRIRLIRLYPLFILGVAIEVASGCVELGFGTATQWTPGKLLISATLALGILPTPPAFGHDNVLYPLNLPSWSLAFEMLINWAFALAWPWLTTRVLCLIAALAAIMLATISKSAGSLDVGWDWGDWYGAVPRVLYSFTMGVLLLRAFRQKTRMLAIGPLLPILALLALLCANPPAHRPLYDVVCVVVVFPLLVMAGASAQPTRLARLYALLGVTSYALYALHFPLLGIYYTAILALSHPTLHNIHAGAGVAFAVIMVFVAYAATTLYDAPVRNWLSRMKLFAAEKSKTPF